MAQFNARDPRYQRDVQRLAAKRGKGVLRSRMGEVAGKHAGYQLGRQLQFGKLAQQKRASNIRDEVTKAGFKQTSRSLGMRERALANQEAAIPYTIASGLGMAGLGYFQAKERKKELRHSANLAERRHNELITTQRYGRRMPHIPGE